MNSRFALSLVLMAVSLAGCERLQAAYTPKAERINAAFPVPEELVTAQNRLFAELEDGSAAKKRLLEAHAQLMQVRALTCSTQADIGRFDTAAEIRRKLTNVACFREQDQAIQSWVGMQRFIVLVGKPAVLPLADLPPRARRRRARRRARLRHRARDPAAGGGSTNDGLLQPLVMPPGFASRGHTSTWLAKLAAAQNTPGTLGIAGARMPAPPVRPMLADVPPDARVAAIGVYEAAVTTQRPGTGRVGGIRVNLGPGTSPPVLVLASYEPVNWHIQDNGRKIAAILASSYGGGSNVLVNGSPNVIRANLGYAYTLGSPEYQRLQQEVAKYLAAPIGSFQGGYKGQEFFVR